MERRTRTLKREVTRTEDVNECPLSWYAPLVTLDRGSQ